MRRLSTFRRPQLKDQSRQSHRGHGPRLSGLWKTRSSGIIWQDRQAQTSDWSTSNAVVLRFPGKRSDRWNGEPEAKAHGHRLNGFSSLIEDELRETQPLQESANVRIEWILSRPAPELTSVPAGEAQTCATPLQSRDAMLDNRQSAAAASPGFPISGMGGSASDPAPDISGR